LTSGDKIFNDLPFGQLDCTVLHFGLHIMPSGMDKISRTAWL